MELFRSEPMELLQLIVPAEAAHDTMFELGQVGCLELKDLNAEKNLFQRKYAGQVMRCAELLRKLRLFEEHLRKGGVMTDPRASFGAGPPPTLDELEATLERHERELLALDENTAKLRRSHSELVELQLVLEKAGGFFDEARGEASGEAAASSSSAPAAVAEESEGQPLLSYAEMAELSTKAVRLGFVAGMVPRERAAGFERVLFRATRGNMFLKQSPIEGKIRDPVSGEMGHKNVYVVFFASERARAKIGKICEAYHASRYPFPEDFGRQRQMNADVTARLVEVTQTLEASEREQMFQLRALAQSLSAWTALVQREKAAFHALNQCSVDVTRQCLVAEGWCPKAKLPRLHAALEEGRRRSRAQLPAIVTPLSPKETPPTHFEVDKVTSSFHAIVEAYGVARYREANPTVFTIVTFPFLFAVMFGDVGHACLLLGFAGYCILNERKLAAKGADLGEIFGMCFEGRYVLLLMALFSLYTGFLYNECFSMPLTVFGDSHYECPSPVKDIHDCPEAYVEGLMMKPGAGPYPFGADPVWHGSPQELMFFNSMKMKMSVVFGVTQMTLGLLMSLANHIHFKNWLSIWAEFIPQLLFLFSIFGYLSMLILLKWATGSEADLYHILIFMFLAPGNVDCAGAEELCPENVLFPGQGPVQVLLVLLALACIPWMLFPKPFVLKRRHEQRHQRAVHYGQLSDVGTHPPPNTAALLAEGGEGAEAGGEEEEFEFEEVFIHQVIHTIEFVLGAVSNTASYLRLWALSLAHAQLSAVFYDRILLMGVSTGNVFALTIAFAVWAMATLAVLMVMETLSAFLHALRLHWVEFQNKFYAGDGRLFTPFSFAQLSKSASDA
mmetsp:Transcript_12583/g.41478  ORF Transcript_12583/g.41478 Transcript_12583/m.41478 type:complete len:844 (-) Transcript_12583:81-2612(-)